MINTKKKEKKVLLTYNKAMPEKTLIEIMRDFENKHNDKMTKLTLGQQENRQETKHIKETVCRIESTLKNFVDSAGTQYADKWVENGLKWGITVVLSTVILAVLGTVIMN